MRGKYWIAIAIVALTVTLSLPYARAAEVGVTDSSILVGSSAGLSGPIANWGNNLSRFAPQAYFNTINEQGGINGRKINYIVYDDAYKPDRAVANVKKLIEKDQVFVIFAQMGTPNNKATYKYVTEEKKVPLIFPATGAHFWGYPYKRFLFPAPNDYWQETWIAVDYMIFTRGLNKIGVFYQDDDYGRDVYDPAVDRIKQHGLEVAGAETYKSGQVDVSSQVVRLKNAGAQAVVLGTVYISGSQFLREAKKIGWNVQAIGISPTGTQKMIELSGEAAPGFVNTMPFPDLESSDKPAVKEYRDIIHKYYPNAPFDDTTMWGWLGAKMLVQMLNLTGKDLTRENLIKAAETKFKNWDSGIIPPVSMSEESHATSISRYLSVVRDLGGGKMRFVPIAPDMEKVQQATPQWLSSWGKTPAQAKPEYEALKKFAQK